MNVLRLQLLVNLFLARLVNHLVALGLVIVEVAQVLGKQLLRLNVQFGKSNGTLLFFVQKLKQRRLLILLVTLQLERGHFISSYLTLHPVKTPQLLVGVDVACQISEIYTDRNQYVNNLKQVDILTVKFPKVNLLARFNCYVLDLFVPMLANDKLADIILALFGDHVRLQTGR